MPHHFVSGVVCTTHAVPHFQIMEEADGKQVCIAMVPFNKHVNPKYSREPARADALKIAKALNLLDAQGTEHYIFKNGWTMRREEPHPHYWLLRNEAGDLVERDKYRHDLIERHRLKIEVHQDPTAI